MSSYLPAVLMLRATTDPMNIMICPRRLPANISMTGMPCLHATQTTQNNQFYQGLRLLLLMMLLLGLPCFRVRRGVNQSRPRIHGSTHATQHVTRPVLNTARPTKQTSLLLNTERHQQEQPRWLSHPTAAINALSFTMMRAKPPTTRVTAVPPQSLTRGGGLPCKPFCRPQHHRLPTIT